MFIGNWVIGPAVSHDDINAAALPSATQGRAAFDVMVARPDPSPYRTPTPDFDMTAQPRYGAMAKERARAELGGRRTVDGTMPEFSSQDSGAADAPVPPRYRVPDRHTGVF
jgi:hypothetical protein